MRDMPLNDWTFRPGFEPGWTRETLDGEAVELPHNAVDLPLTYLDERSYQRPFTYQRRVAWEDRFEGQEVLLVFEGAMADAAVWVDGEEVARHRDGYTPFEARLTGRIGPDGVLVTVRVDGSENPEIPPFGGQIDYLTYAGLYREAALRVVPRVSVANVKVETPEPLAESKSVRARVFLRGEGRARVEARLLDQEGREVARAAVDASGGVADLAFDGLEGLRLWRPDDPALHVLDVRVASEAGEDAVPVRFGFREARWTPDGFVLNGEPLKVMGLNRHQSFPFSGYGQGRMSQRRDAEILKWDLRCNLVRTSHYPQSRHFLDRCDEIGLLVFEEIPGWQHIGGEAWKRETVENVRRMIERDWNRPSIVIWGVRINESQDDHDLYAETNRLARELDPTRQTGGVRYITGSELLEDVYTMNDFVLGEPVQPGSNVRRTALRPKELTTGLKASVPYLVTEFNGHMFPTKAGDGEERLVEHAVRHLEVLDAAWGDPGIAGAIGWCFFDYNTHKDFGSGDRVCHHGVSTFFREPKWAAYAYASQRPVEAGVVMRPLSYFARGERAIGGVLPLLVLTNCEEVEFRYGDAAPVRVGPDRERFPHLPHPPVVIDRHHFEGLGVWGMSWEDGEVLGLVGGEVVARHRWVSDPLPTTLEVAPDALTLDAAMRDEVRVMIRALDQAGNVVPFLLDAAWVSVEGPARLIGPPLRRFAGGTTGLWLRATGEAGTVRVTAASERFAPATVELQAV